MSNFTPQQIEEFLQEFFDVVGARQYVGARYVPIFGRAGEDTVEWDNLAPYEPLTVVMHEGVSYVSRRYVPRGIQITDTDYWAQTYRFNAQVEQYRQEVLSFQGQIDGIRQTMESDYVPFPDGATLPKYGTAGQVLGTLTNGNTQWVDPVVPSDEQATEIIDAWLAAHPEATTTVQDGAITPAKMANTGINTLSPIHLIMRDNGYVQLDTVNKTLTFPNDTIVEHPLGRYALPNAVTVNLATVGSSAIKVVFDTSDNTFKAQIYTANSTKTQQVIAGIRLLTSERSRVSASFPYTIDGDLYGIYIRPDVQLILASGRYVNLDTTNKTLTIPSDSVLVGPTFRKIINTNLVIDLSGAGTTAVKVMYNSSTEQFTAEAYTANSSKTTVVFAAVRCYQTDSSRVSGNFPYSIDGRPYGLYVLGKNPYNKILSVVPEHIKSVCHRGFSTVAPENTIPAFTLAKQNGFSYVETDVEYTSDGVAVLLHDSTINRTARNADGTEIVGTVPISSITYQQALDYDFGIWKGATYAGTKIPTFEQFMKVCRDLSLHPYVELKTVPNPLADNISALVDTVRAYGMIDNVTFISFTDAYLTAVATIETRLRLGLLTNALTAAQVATAQTLINGGSDVFIDAYGGDSGAEALCIAANIPLEQWTYNAASISSASDYATGYTVEDFVVSKHYFNQYLGSL